MDGPHHWAGRFCLGVKPLLEPAGVLRMFRSEDMATVWRQSVLMPETVESLELTKVAVVELCATEDVNVWVSSCPILARLYS